MNPNPARRASVEVVFDGTDITKDILPYLLSATYTDNEDGEADDLQLKLQDRDSLWLEQWLTEAVEAAAGAKLKISASFARQNWGANETLSSGEMELDSVTASGPPATVTIKGTSLPFSAPLRQTKKTKAWESYKLSGIAKEIAAGSGMSCLFESEYDPFYKRTEQRKTSDSEFLLRLCRDAGISLKTSDGQIVLFDQSKYEKLPPVMIIQRRDWKYEKYTLSTGAANRQYASCRVRCTDPKTGKCIEGIYTDDEEKTEQRLEIGAKVSSVGEAKLLAEKHLRLHNKLSRTAKFTLPGDPNLVAGLTVLLKDWGGWDGKYIIQQAVHSVSSTAGYTTQTTLRRCLKGY